MYDITKKSSFDSVERWLTELHENADKKVVQMIVGNKSDLEQAREVKSEEGEELAKKHNAFFFETSALDGNHVEEAFTVLLKKIYDDSANAVTEDAGHTDVKPVVDPTVDINKQGDETVSEGKKCC